MAHECTDFPPGTGTCINNDGTGLWCDNCLEASVQRERAARIDEIDRLREERDWWRARAIKLDPLLELVEISEEAGLYDQSNVYREDREEG